MKNRILSRRLSRVSAVRQLATREWPILLGLLVPAAAIWILLELADEVREGSTAALDEALLLLFRSPVDQADPLGPPWLQEMMRDFTALGGVGVLSLIALAACGYLILVRKRRAALAVLLAVAGGVLISQLIKAGIDRPRPDLVPHGSYVSTASFPSGHSMMAATVYLTLAAMLARVQPRWRSRSYLIGCAIFIVMLVGISRVYLGVHWPTDVLAGWSVGAGWAIGCWAATVWLQRRGAVEGEGDMPAMSGEPPSS
jgi:undecaprenyl-diphosphatase